jgi:hypothetical protein
MKKARTLIATAFLLATVSICTQAQERPLVKANIPFAFNVRNATLPPGTYNVTALGPLDDVIKVQSVDGRKNAMVLALIAEEPVWRASRGSCSDASAASTF